MMSVAPNARADRLPVGVPAHRDDAGRAQPRRGEHRAQPDRAVADHDDDVAGTDVRRDGGVMPGRRDVGEGEQVRDERVVDGTGYDDKRALAQRHADQLTLRAVDRQALLVAAAEERDVVADAGRAGQARLARAVAQRERRDHEVADVERGDLVAALLDDADHLVTHQALRAVAEVPVAPEIRSAHAGGDHAHDDVGRGEDRRIRPVHESDIAGTGHDRRLHGSKPRRASEPVLARRHRHPAGCDGRAAHPTARGSGWRSRS